MTHNAFIRMNICDECHRALRDMTETWSASGYRHYCSECWPHHRDHYEDERAWKRIGNRYLPNE